MQVLSLEVLINLIISLLEQKHRLIIVSFQSFMF